jgi:protein-S-isoprenylcysteine O-methyltransferase Ste14
VNSGFWLGMPRCNAQTFITTPSITLVRQTGASLLLNEDMMRKVLAILGSAVFLVIAPGFVAGLVPWWISRWRVEAPFFGMPLLRFVGGMLTTLGVICLLDSFVRFALQGVGTPAPVFPTRHLVVTGLYRYVRNPIYVAVVVTILGQGLILGNATLLEYGGLVLLLFHVFVLVYEEPTLRASFGSEYKSFCAEVPRWIPRFTAWRNHPET